MKRYNITHLAGCLALAWALAMPAMPADVGNRKTDGKFRDPVDTPVVHLSEDEKTVHATFRRQATSKTVITFRERGDGEPEAPREWFKAMALAKPTQLPIRLLNEAAVIERKRMPIMAIKHSGEEVRISEVVTPPPATETARTEPAPATATRQVPPAATAAPQATLPATASDLPLFAIIGILALGCGLAIREFTKRLQ
jgi:hypothetical protein